MAKRVAIYLRVSTDEQTTANQERALREVAAHSGHEIVAVYRDEGDQRFQGPRQAPRLRRHAQGRQPAQVRYRHGLVGRSARAFPEDLIGFLSELHALGIDLALHQQGIDTTTPAGKAMFQMMGVFAEFERSMIRERVNAGIARAKAVGKHCGRPFIDTKLEGRIRDALATPGRPGLHKLAKQFGVGTGTVQRIAHG